MEKQPKCSLYRGIVSNCFFNSVTVDCACYKKDFVVSRFCSIHCTVTLARLKNIVRCIEDSVIIIEVH